MKSILVLSVLTFTLVGCQSEFAGQGDSAFFAVEKSSNVGDPLMAEPSGEESVGEDPVGEEPRDDDDVIVIIEDGGTSPSTPAPSVADQPANQPATDSSKVGSSSDPVLPPGSSVTSSGTTTGGDTVSSPSGSTPVTPSAPPVVLNPCESATDGQSCMDLKCEPVTENDAYVRCLPPGTSGKPVIQVSSIKKDCSNLPEEASVPGKSKKAIICHQMGNGGYQTIVIACPAVKAHVDHHNDSVGVCPANH